MPKKPYISQEYTLTFGNVPGEQVSDLIDKFAKRARTGGTVQPASIVDFDVDTNVTEENEPGTEDVIMTFTYQCHGAAPADIRRFAQRAIAKLSGDTDQVSIEVKPGTLKAKYMVPDEPSEAEDNEESADNAELVEMTD